MDKIQRYLFFRFPRDMGNPYRKTIKNYREFDDFVRVNNHINPVFTSLYDTERFEIDKIFIDIDAFRLRDALKSTQKICSRLEDSGVDYIVVFSGKKGFHIYVPVDFPNYSVGYVDKCAIVKSIQTVLTYNVPHVDTHVFGDIHRMVRVPNTYHTFRYCVYIPDIMDMTVKDILEEAKEPSNKFIKPRHKLKIDLNEIKIRKTKRYSDAKPLEHVDLPIPVDSLKYFVRPCIAEALSDPNPPHYVRFTLVTELMWAGFDMDSVLDLIEKLEWFDYDRQKTMEYVEQIYNKRYKPYSCKSLREKGIMCRKCGWQSWWFGE